jgi:hypothetical protein
LSLQIHHHRAEHWVAINGNAHATRDQDRMMCARMSESACCLDVCTGWKSLTRSR